ncbi:ATP synthase F1 subunit epsilon [candidate division WWE3 bacterium]|uniref:ATP synthase epsilon chain n=1 Tax=candidate division WWE3 bacterium TaxID=2053526 RepID=A0A955RQ48_UNCKA|nr:ATP synthase F1 subunit epsilon [candidate division WWE3 bacterium]
MLKVSITTVERTVFSSDNVAKITLPTKEGVITVLPNHASLVSALSMGEAIVYTDESPNYMFLDGGVVEINDNTVHILATAAEQAEELDEARIEEARRRAEKILEENPVDVDLAKVETSLQRELMKQKLVRKWQQYK